MLSGQLRHENIHQKIRSLKEKWNSDIHLLFLDFDGVFIVPRQNREVYLHRIAKFCQLHHLKVVVTSTWRFDMNNCLQILQPYVTVIGCTELEGKDRNLQIMNYLETHPFHHFLILDDMFLEPFQDYAVQCDFFTGFDEKAYDKAIQIIQRQKKEG